MEDLLKRRDLLQTKANPEAKRDYIVTLQGHRLSRFKADIWYVPDKLVVEASSLRPWLEAVEALDWSDLESLAVTLRDDLNNELVPRWLQIIVTDTASPETQPVHQVILEDRQPRWENRHLLGRIRRV